MFRRFTKVIIHLAVLTSKSVFSFQAPVIVMNDIANNETSFPGCETSASDTWCNSIWADNNNHQPPLDNDGLKNCYLSNQCCPHPASITQFSQCPNYGIYKGVEAGFSFIGLVLITLGRGDQDIRKHLLRLLGSVLLIGGLGAIAGTVISGSSDDPAGNIVINTCAGAGTGGLFGIMLWSVHTMRAMEEVAPAPIPLGAAGALPPPVPARRCCTIL